MLVCSPSTRNFFPNEKKAIIVNKPFSNNDIFMANAYKDVIAVGGGTVIDVAKILSKNPIKCYPTTASGSCCTSHSVYWEKHTKKSLKCLLPSDVYIKKDFLKNLPDNVIKYTKCDVISHCLDVTWSVNKTYKSMFYVDAAMEILKGSYDISDLIRAGNLAGMAIENCSTTILHSLSYPLTGFYNIPHGKALCFLLPIICNFMNFDISIYLNSFNTELNNIDMNFVIKESLKYNKIYNFIKTINFDILTTIFKEYL
jgi:alcohol dehydrogenase class IV